MIHGRDEFEVHAQVAWQHNAIDVFVGFRQEQTGKFYVANPVTYSVSSEDASIQTPLLRLTKTEAQQLIDAMWNCGVRPTRGEGSAGSFDAQGRHLEDMRAIVFARTPGATKP